MKKKKIFNKPYEYIQEIWLARVSKSLVNITKKPRQNILGNSSLKLKLKLKLKIKIITSKICF